MIFQMIINKRDTFVINATVHRTICVHNFPFWMELRIGAGVTYSEQEAHLGHGRPDAARVEGVRHADERVFVAKQQVVHRHRYEWLEWLAEYPRRRERGRNPRPEQRPQLIRLRRQRLKRSSLEIERMNRRNERSSHQQRNVRRHDFGVFVNAQLGHKLQNFLVLKRHRVIIVKFNIHFFHILSVKRNQFIFMDLVNDSVRDSSAVNQKRLNHCLRVVIFLFVQLFNLNIDESKWGKYVELNSLTWEHFDRRPISTWVTAADVLSVRSLNFARA